MKSKNWRIVRDVDCLNTGTISSQYCSLEQYQNQSKTKQQNSPIERFHLGRGFSYFSSYGNSILYNERVEIGGYTIQFYHKLEQPFRSYCHNFLYTSQWVVYNFCTLNGLPIHFQWGLQIFKYL